MPDPYPCAVVKAVLLQPRNIGRHVQMPSEVQPRDSVNTLGTEEAGQLRHAQRRDGEVERVRRIVEVYCLGVSSNSCQCVDSAKTSGGTYIRRHVMASARDDVTFLALAVSFGRDFVHFQW